MWKKVEDWPYCVSDKGHVRREETGRIRKLALTTEGYLQVTLWKRNTSKTFLVHRLVLHAFFPDASPVQVEANHKDGNKTNNVLSNLEWCTSSENHLHACRVLKKGLGVENGNARLTEEKVRQVRILLARGDTQRCVAEVVGVTQHSISLIACGKTWNHVN